MSNVLKINWSFGFSKDITNGVHSLSHANRNAIFFVSSHSGVIYDYEHRTQMVLQGHCNLISCCAVSDDKRWIVTADIGEDPILVVWDSVTGAPVKTFFSPHAKGVRAVDISDDGQYITTLSEPEQVRDMCSSPACPAPLSTLRHLLPCSSSSGTDCPALLPSQPFPLIT